MTGRAFSIARGVTGRTFPIVRARDAKAVGRVFSMTLWRISISVSWWKAGA